MILIHRGAKPTPNSFTQMLSGNHNKAIAPLPISTHTLPAPARDVDTWSPQDGEVCWMRQGFVARILANATQPISRRWAVLVAVRATGVEFFKKA